MTQGHACVILGLANLGYMFEVEAIRFSPIGVAQRFSQVGSLDYMRTGKFAERRMLCHCGRVDHPLVLYFGGIQTLKFLWG